MELKELISNNFSVILKRIMDERSLSQLALLKLIGNRQSQISRWLNRKGLPNLYYLLILCEKLNVTPDYLMGKK